MNKRFSIFISVLCILFLLLGYGIVATVKVVPSGDETISYLCATGNQQHYEAVMNKQSAIYGHQTGADEWSRFFTATPGSLKNVAADLVKTDLHPPLYFWLLRFFTFLPVSLFASGLILNLVLHLLSFFVLFKLTKQLGLNPLSQLFVLLGWCLSPAVMGVGFYARQYELLAFFNLLAAILFISYQQTGRLVYLGGLLFAFVAGMLTQYLLIYFSFVFAGYVLLINRNKKQALYLLLATVAALILTWLAHPGIIQQFATQQARAQDFSGLPGLVARTGKVILSFVQLFIPVLAMKGFFMALPKVLVAVVSVGLIGAAAFFGFKYRHHFTGFSIKQVHPFIYWMLFCSVALAVLPYLLFLTPMHAMGGPYFTLVYPFLLISVGNLVSQHIKVLAAAISLIAVGWAMQLILLFNQHQQYKPLLAQINQSDIIVVNTVNRRGFLRFVPMLKQQKVIMNEQAAPCDVAGKRVLFIAEEVTKPDNVSCTASSAVYDLQDGVVLYTFTLSPSASPSLSK